LERNQGGDVNNRHIIRVEQSRETNLEKDPETQLASKAQVIFLILPGPSQVEQVTNEILESNYQPGLIICDFTTSTPQTSQAINQQCADVGILFLDTPILGRPSRVGHWCLPVGGDAEAIKNVTPLLEGFASKIIRVGDSGAGHTLKLLNQLMFNVTNAMVAEMFSVAAKSGIDPQVIYEVIAESGAATVSGLFKEVGRKIVARDFDPLFSIDLLIKDARLSLEMAESWDMTPALGVLAQKQNLDAHNLGLGGEDTSALIKIFE
jgi:3-hydroxyisobutyrate dehydrogenase-like beta-hydroxyacid dehydrogenase